MRTVPLHDAVALIPNGATLMVGGFVGVGTPERLMDELVRQGKGNLTVIANDTGLPGVGIGKLVTAGLLRKVIVSHIGLNPETQQQMLAGKLEVELVPQGTLIERIRSGGFGLGGILTPTGIGTVVEKDKRKIEVNGKEYLLETALRADFALVHAFVADYIGNLTYILTARNFNPVIAMAGETVIVTADHVVPVGMFAPDQVATLRRSWITSSSVPDFLRYGCSNHYRPADRPGTSFTHVGQPGHRHSNTRRQLCSGGYRRFLSNRERTYRDRTDACGGHGVATADGCRRQAGDCPAWG